VDLRSDMTIGERLAVARRYAKLTQEELAERSEVHVDTIQKLEQNRRQGARRVAVREHTNGRGAAASAVLAKTSQLAAHVLVQHGQEDLALLGLDRAGAAAAER
jgi:transcriptional regulator with XRE-family HTH domain